MKTGLEKLDDNGLDLQGMLIKLEYLDRLAHMMRKDAEKEENQNLEGQPHDTLLPRPQTKSECDDRERLLSVTVHTAHAYPCGT